MVNHDKYDDPVKQESRRRQYLFAKRNLGSVPNSDRTVVYLPGPKNLEWWIYKKLYIEPKNALGLESRRDNFRALKRNRHGINILQTRFEDYFAAEAQKANPASYNIISLDTEGQLNEELGKTLTAIVENQMLRCPGIIVTNVYGQREQEKVKNGYKSWEQFRRTLGKPLFFDKPFDTCDVKVTKDHIMIKPQMEKVDEDPLEFRSDAISGNLLSIIYSAEAGTKNIINKIETLRKYNYVDVDKHYIAVAKRLLKSDFEINFDVLNDYVNNKISLQEAAYKDRQILFNIEMDFIQFLQKHSPEPGFTAILHTAFVDPLQVVAHERLQYLSKTKGNMYMDMVAVNRPTEMHVGPIIEELLDRLVLFNGTFAVRGSKKEANQLKKRFERIIPVAQQYLDDATEFACDARTILEVKPKIVSVPSDLESFEKIRIPTKPLDLLPNKFYTRMSPSQQEALDDFINRLNDNNVTKRAVEEIKDSKWYKKGTFALGQFHNFLNGLCNYIFQNDQITKEDIKEILSASQNGATFQIEPPKPKLEPGIVNKNHPDYEKEKIEIQNLLSEGNSIDEIKRLKPHVNPHTVSSIAAWHRHRDSWEKTAN